MPNVTSVPIRCKLLSAVEARISWPGVSPWTFWTETCNRFVAEGKVETGFRFEGAENGKWQTPTGEKKTCIPTGPGLLLPISDTGLFEAQSQIEDVLFFQHLVDRQVSLLYATGVGRKSGFGYER